MSATTRLSHSSSHGAGTASKNIPAVAATTTTTTPTQPAVVIEMSGAETMTMDNNPMRTTKRRSTIPPPLPTRPGRHSRGSGSGSSRAERVGKKDTSLSGLEAI